MVIGNRFAFAIAALFGLSACSKHSVRYYEMLVEIETPAGVKQGQVTRKVTYHGRQGGWFPLGESSPSTSVEGTAVAVDLPDQRRVYALLQGSDGSRDYAENIVAKMMPDFLSMSGASPWIDIPLCGENLGSPQSEVSRVPKMIVLSDVHDLSTIRVFRPCAMDYKPELGFSVKRIAVRSADRASKQSDTHLPDFVFDQADLTKWYQSLPPSDPRIIYREDFVRP